jgi:phosphohistidine phosphatase
MKKLFLIRHAKSDWSFDLKDFDRPLNPRGMKDAPQMGKHLKSNHIHPDLIMSSSANRAISTARLIANEIGYPLNDIQENDNVYHASPQDILKQIWKVDDKIDTLFVFGHNPGLSELVEYLSDEPTELKTCCVAVLKLEVEQWAALVSGTCILEDYLSPKEI